MDQLLMDLQTSAKLESATKLQDKLVAKNGHN